MSYVKQNFDVTWDSSQIFPCDCVVTYTFAGLEKDVDTF